MAQLAWHDDGQMAWGLLGIGAAFERMIMCGARAPMLIGGHLPFDHFAILLGGVMQDAWCWERTKGGTLPRQRAHRRRGHRRESTGVVHRGNSVVHQIAVRRGWIRVVSGYGGWLGIVAFMAVGWVLIRWL
jgi:hypothetical protein